MDLEVKSSLSLAMSELRFRKDFVVLHKGTRDGRVTVKRTPPLTYWQARDWLGMTELHQGTAVELVPANRQTLAIERLQVCQPREAT